MHVVLVYVHVLEEHIEDFKQATLLNARSSLKEAGVARFDVIQNQEDPSRFVLVEVYRNSQAPADHKQTGHYLAWRDEVSSYMAEARQGVAYTSIFPENDLW